MLPPIRLLIKIFFELPVTIYINSPGGEINAGLMIYDAIHGSELEINMVCTGIAASMAAIFISELSLNYAFNDKYIKHRL